MSDLTTGFGGNLSLARADGPTTLEGEDRAALPKPILRSYQEDAVAFQLKRDRSINALPPGGGKTATVISALAQRTPQPSPVLVLAPLSVVRHWETEIARWSGYRPVVGVGSAAQRRQAREHLEATVADAQTEEGPHLPFIYVTNYEAAKADKSALFDIPWQAVVCDEAHRLKSRKSQTFKFVRQIALPAPVCILVTGTPLLNRVDELWSLLHITDPKKWKSYWPFVDVMCETNTTTFNGKLAFPVKQITGMRPGMDGVLRQQLRDVMFRRSLEEILPELPEITETIYEVDLSPEERRVYDKMEKSFFADMPDGSKIVAPTDVAKITRLRQMADDWSILGATEGSSTKTKRLYELLADIGDEQVVIFSSFAKVIDPVAAHLMSGKITGSVKHNDRNDVITAFATGNLQYVCGTIGAMGEGVNLQSAHHVILLDLPWVPALKEQAIARVHRYGQGADHVFVHVIAARNTIDAYIAKTLSRKEAVIDSLVGSSWYEVLHGSDDVGR